jgi:aminoglycoside phosphotransferase (APT) family kinase protein
VAARTGLAVADEVALVGGMSSDVSRVRLADDSTLVVRHFADAEWLGRHPDIIDQEATALEILARSELPTPSLIAAEGAAGLLAMSELPGTMRMEGGFLADHVDAIAEVATRVAAVDLPAGHGLGPWRQWIADEPHPPEWGEPSLWSAAVDAVTRRPPPEGPAVLLHRDLHPLNLLWAGDAVSGVVDWVNACVGHPHAELGHCRWNLTVLAGPAVAGRFLDRYLQLTNSGPYDPWWDLCVPISFLPGEIGRAAWHAVGRDDLSEARVVAATERFLADALLRT